MKDNEIWQAFFAEEGLQTSPVAEWILVNPEKIPFSGEVRAACEANLCGRYGKCWTCPPGAGDWQALREEYRGYPKALIFSTCHPLEDSFDLEGMDEGRVAHDLLDKAVLAFAKERLPGRFVLLGAGSCSRCPTCTYPDAPCRHPESARRSMEACGIDVVSLCRNLGLHYMNGENTVTYFSVLFYEEA